VEGGLAARGEVEPRFHGRAAVATDLHGGKGGKGITLWFVTTCGGVREYVWDKSAKE